MDREQTTSVSVTEPPSASLLAKNISVIVAIAATAALLDAAVETVWNGSSIGWWIAPPVVAFVAVSGWLWRRRGWLARRAGWPGAAVSSVTALLLLLVASAWLPGGQSDGVRMILQPTSTLLAVVTAAAVILAAFVLARALALIPPAVRVPARAVLIAVAAYALVAIGLAIYQRAPYAALFQGGAPWQRLPRWLQGTFLGALGLLPLALLAQTVRLIDHLRRKEPVRILVHQGVALVMAFVMALSGVIMPGSVVGPNASAASAQQRRQMAGHLDQLFQALEAAEKEIPRDTFDPRSVVEKVGKDPIRLFEWVRDNTYWVPYRGALRGPVGVLMDRLGNSLDRSLLLAELLEIAGHQVQLAHGQVGEGQAHELLAQVRPAPATARPEPPNVEQMKAAIDKYAKANGLDTPQLQTTLKTLKRQSDRLSNDLERRVVEQTDMVFHAVGVPAPEDQPAPGKDLAALADHWWVQRLDQAQWVDLDPLLPDRKPGATVVQAEETFPLEVADGKVHLDARFCHEVQIRVVAEQQKDGALTEKVALEHTLRPADLFDQSVVLQQVLLEWPRDLDLAKEKDPAARLASEAVKATEWVPVLSIGDTVIVQSSIRMNGEVNDEPAGGASMPGGAGLGSLMGGLGGAEDEEQKSGGQQQKSDGQLTAEWIEYTLRVPGETPRTIRRELFDRLGPAARQAGTADTAPAALQAVSVGLLDRTQVLMQVSRCSTQFLLDAMARRILDHRQAIADLLKGAAPSAVQAGELMRSLMPVSPALLNVAVGRFAGKGRFSDVYLDCPNVFTYRTGVRFNEKNEAVFEALFDIVENTVAAQARDHLAAFRARVEQGVTDTAIEGLQPVELQAGANAATIFAQATADGIRPVPIRRADDAALATLDLRPDPAARIRASLADGYALVAPARPVRMGTAARMCWYRVDARTGGTVGVLDTGFHGQDSVDYGVTLKKTSVNVVARTAVAAPPSAGGTSSMIIDLLLWANRNPGVAALAFLNIFAILWFGAIFLWMYIEDPMRH